MWIIVYAGYDHILFLHTYYILYRKRNQVHLVMYSFRIVSLSSQKYVEDLQRGHMIAHILYSFQNSNLVPTLQ